MSVGTLGIQQQEPHLFFSRLTLKTRSYFSNNLVKFHQMITKWIFLKSAGKGLLKHVQDGISRPLGSQEIKKIKVESVLLDTLYLVKEAFKSEAWKWEKYFCFLFG